MFQFAKMQNCTRAGAERRVCPPFWKRAIWGKIRNKQETGSGILKGRSQRKEKKKMVFKRV